MPGSFHAIISCYMRVFVPIDNKVNKRLKKEKDKSWKREELHVY